MMGLELLFAQLVEMERRLHQRLDLIEQAQREINLRLENLPRAINIINAAAGAQVGQAVSGSENTQNKQGG